MFTGIVEEIGRVARLEKRGEGVRIEIHAEYPGVQLGESIAVDGVCLTVAKHTDEGFELDLSSETLARTTLNELAAGTLVHLERALRLSDRLGGHLVTGHIDGLASIVERHDHGAELHLTLTTDARLMPYIAEKGSVALDGVSLTVNAVRDATFRCVLVPYTLVKTHFGRAAVGQRVNLEVDLVARYVQRLFQAQSGLIRG